MDTLAGFIGGGLSAGDAGVVVAKPAHRHELDKRLTAWASMLPRPDRKISSFLSMQKKQFPSS
jgi:hypothetical protein